MNAIRFIVDDYDNVLKCVCTHDISGSEVDTIEMEPGRLNSLLRLFADEYKQIDEKINKNAIILTFYDVDDDALTELVRMSNEYRQKLERIRAKAHQERRYQTETIDYTCDKEYIKGKNKTVTRKKNNKKTVIATFAALTLSTVMLLSITSKAETKVTNNEDINPQVSYAQNIEIDDDINKEFTVTTPPIVDIKEEVKETIPSTPVEEVQEEKVNPFTLETEDLTGSEKYQNALREQNYNVPRAIQCYNYGSAYMDQVISECCRDTGYSRSDISDPTNLIWTNYRSVIKNGDDRYLENVLRYLPNDTQIEFKKPSGETITMTFENETFNDNMKR